MLTEYKIKFEDGCVIITQRVTAEVKKDNTSEKEPDEEIHLPDGFVTANSTTPSAAPSANVVRATPLSGGGEADSGTPGGGGPLLPGLVVVFGTLVAGGGMSTLGSGEADSGTPGGQRKPGE